MTTKSPLGDKKNVPMSKTTGLERGKQFIKASSISLLPCFKPSLAPMTLGLESKLWGLTFKAYVTWLFYVSAHHSLSHS